MGVFYEPGTAPLALIAAHGASRRDTHTNLAEQIMIILIVVIIKGD
ncbi:hypothetical protein MES5069_550135 [Mesorhizobium escarrei]|uniref:Uncharacterized protein n=1 Tax=Mesorhizobium escarrei TaxID=666018 RepID=A0ABM9ECX3_9HYPH|nr:hypothetical protein MES5069_550135 [Mesorhizobium escarrei]